jgi:putative endonuclease
VARFDTIAVYIMSDRRYGVLYTGVTSDLVDRMGRHRAGEGAAFTKKYNCHRLVWYEVHADMRVAIQREKSIKRYLREWKIKLIEADNPDWIDLWSEILPGPLPGERVSIEELRRGANRDPRDEPEDDSAKR